MKGAWTIFRRELYAYLNAPMTYIFIVVFVFVSTLLFLLLSRFFEYPVADLTDFFGWLVPVLCVFAPAATMRIWAEERKENTIELLLTFPLSPWALVLGKYLAALACYAVTLACTWLLPLMVGWLGDPDGGAILAGYLGALCFGGLGLALGQLVSGFCREQVTAFVVSFLIFGGLALVGWQPLAVSVDVFCGWLPVNLGSLLRRMVGVTDHYLAFTRGVIDLADVLYFLVWIGLLLLLNRIYLEGRSRPRMRRLFLTALALVAVVGGTLNWLVADFSLLRLDLTENKIYTVADASRRILTGLKLPAQVKVYLSPVELMPTELKDFERELKAKLRELELAGGGKLEWKVVHLDPRNLPAEELAPAFLPEDASPSLEQQLAQQGVVPFDILAADAAKETQQRIYSSLGVACGGRPEEILPQHFLPQNLPELEYELMRAIQRQGLSRLPIVALVAPRQRVDPQMLQFWINLGQPPPQGSDYYSSLEQLLRQLKFEVRRVDLTGAEPLPEEYDALLVVDPQRLDARQQWELNRALVNGRPVLLAVQQYDWSYSEHRGALRLNAFDQAPGVNAFLAASGLGVDEQVLLDRNCTPLLKQLSESVRLPLRLPLHIVVTCAGAEGRADAPGQIPLTAGLDLVSYFWGTALRIDEARTKALGLEVRPFLWSSANSWKLPAAAVRSEDDLLPPATGMASYPLAALVRGQFADAWPGPERPAWPPPRSPLQQPPEATAAPRTEPAPPAEARPGTLILIGSAHLFSDDYLPRIRQNAALLINCVDALTLGADLVQIQAKRPVSRVIPPADLTYPVFWKLLTLLGMPALVAAAGLLRALVLYLRRKRYRAALRTAGLPAPAPARPSASPPAGPPPGASAGGGAAAESAKPPEAQP